MHFDPKYIEEELLKMNNLEINLTINEKTAYRPVGRNMPSLKDTKQFYEIMPPYSYGCPSRFGHLFSS